MGENEEGKKYGGGGGGGGDGTINVDLGVRDKQLIIFIN